MSKSKSFQSFNKQLLDTWGTRCDAELWPLREHSQCGGKTKCPGLPRNKSKEHCVQPTWSTVPQPPGTPFVSSIFGRRGGGRGGAGQGGVPEAEAWEVCHPLLSSRPTTQTLGATIYKGRLRNAMCAVCSLFPAPR